MSQKIEQLVQHEIPGRVAVSNGNGGLTKVVVTSKVSTAEIYLHGAHVVAFQKNGEPPLIFMSSKSRFAAGEAIRGGVPICFPWFGSHAAGGPSHGFARISEWELAETSETKDGMVTVRLRLPVAGLNPDWSGLRAEFVVTVTDTLTMELIATNNSADQTLEIENCLHTYFQVGDIGAVSITGLQGASYVDNAGDGHGALKTDGELVLRIARETNRLYQDIAGPVEISDENLKRTIRVEKFNSNSTVVWNPWTTQKMPDDFDPVEHARMVCVEAGNIKRNKIFLAPGKTDALKVTLSSIPLK